LHKDLPSIPLIFNPKKKKKKKPELTRLETGAIRESISP